MDIPIIYQDKDLLIVNKAAGIASCSQERAGPVSKESSDCLSRHAQVQLRNGGHASDHPLSITKELQISFPELLTLPDHGACHRLDTDTSGLVVIARNQKTWEAMRELFSRNKVQKEYVALVHGAVLTKGKIEFPIGSDPKSSKRVKVYRNKAEARRNKAQEAVTWYEPIPYETSSPFLPLSPALLPKGERVHSVTLLLVRIKTGRRHQIRAHLASIGYPIVGDKIYGRASSTACPPAGRRGPAHHLLHASSLSFIHPSTHQPIATQCPLPDDFMNFPLRPLAK